MSPILKHLLLAILLFNFLSCKKEVEVKTPSAEKDQYIFLGHIYNKNDKVDPRLETIDYQSYKGVWLGGDLCAETTRKRSTIDYLDELFDLDSEDTHWAVGNHDVRNGNLDWITTATGRDLFYSNTKDGLTIAVIDNNVGHVKGRDASCEERIAQGEFLYNLLDTIEHSSHLIILMHWVIWGETEEGMICKGTANNCLSTFQFLCGGAESKFPPFLYEKLVAVEERGVEVLLLSGDGGIFSKQYHYETKEGIDFFISGIFSTLDRANPPASVVVNLNPDSVLLFNHEVATQQLTWEFANLDELVE